MQSVELGTRFLRTPILNPLDNSFIRQEHYATVRAVRQSQACWQQLERCTGRNRHIALHNPHQVRPKSSIQATKSFFKINLLESLNNARVFARAIRSLFSQPRSNNLMRIRHEACYRFGRGRRSNLRNVVSTLRAVTRVNRPGEYLDGIPHHGRGLQRRRWF